MMKRTLTLLLLVSLMLIGTAATAFAAPELAVDQIEPGRPRPPTPEPQPITVLGKVVEIGSRHFLLTAVGGREFHVRVSDETRFVIPGVQEPGLDDLRRGDEAAVTGLLSPISAAIHPNVIDAKLVVVRRPVPEPVQVQGVVRNKAVAGFDLVSEEGRTHKILVDNETRFKIEGVEDPTYNHVREGDQATVWGLPVLDPTGVTPAPPILAKLVQIRRPQPEPVKVEGIVRNKAVAGFDLVSEEGRTHKILVNNETRFKIEGVEDPTYSHVREGDDATVWGLPVLDSTGVTPSPPILAKLIQIRRPQPEPVKVEGIVRNKAEAGFDLVSDEGRTHKILVNNETRFKIEGVEDPTYRHVREGDDATVWGLPVLDSTGVTPAPPILAKLVQIRRLQPEPVKVEGIVRNKAEAGFDLVSEEGRVHKILVGDQTRYQITGIPNPTYENVRDGDDATVWGLPVLDTPSITPAPPIAAQLVRIRRPWTHSVRGTVRAFLEEDRRGFVLAGEDGVEWTVLVDADTRFRIQGVEDPDLSDVVIGDKALVTSRPTTSDTPTITADLVVISRPMLELKGEVTEVNEDSLRLLVREGEEWLIMVDEDTEFRIPGVADPGLDDINVGDQAIIIGPRPTHAALMMTANIIAIPHPYSKVHGRVTEILDDGFKLLAENSLAVEGHIPPQREWTIRVNNETQLRIPGVQDPGLDDVQVGDHADVLGVQTSSGAPELLAKIVTIPNPIFRVTGRVTQVLGSGFKLQAMREGEEPEAAKGNGAEWMVHVNDETEYRIPGVPDPGLDDIQVGDKAMVVSEAPHGGSHSITAKLVVVQKPTPVRLAGVVTAKDGEAFAMELVSGESVRIWTNRSTEWIIPGVQNPNIHHLMVGAKALVWAHEEGDRLTALKVIAYNPRPRPVQLTGTIVRVGNSEFALELRSGEVKVIAVDEETVYRVPGVKDPGLGDLPIGAHAYVAALADPQGNLLAKKVVVQRPRPQYGRVLGEITKITREAITVATEEGEKTVQVSDDTIYRIPHAADPGLGDLALGDRIVAVGEWVDDNTLLAKAIGLLPPPTTE